MRDYRAVGPYGLLRVGAVEADASRAHLAAGQRMALLKRSAVRHIGDGRRVGDAARLKTFGARMSRKIRQRLYWIGMGPPPRTRKSN